MGIDASFNFRRVSDTVTTSGVIPRDALAGIGAEGYGLLVNLLPDDSEHAVEDEADLVTDQGVDYVHIPVAFEAPRSEQVDRFVEAMAGAAGRTVHVHCAANYRVSAFYGLYAELREIWTREQADEHIRTIWDPDDDPVWRDFLASERARLAPPSP